MAPPGYAPPAEASSLALSILVPTLNRLASLLEVLAGLAAGPVEERFEVVVIDNGSEPALTADAIATPRLPGLRLLRETRPGKWCALNRAIDEGGLGEIVAVLDDDMSPPPDWVRGVLAATRARPQYDIFSGKSHVVWPEGIARPPWAGEPLTQGLLFSVFDTGSAGDVEFGDHSPRFPTGNHFWFRRSALDGGERFRDAFTSEAQFVAHLGAAGHRGVFVPDVAIGHRIQPGLVDPRRFRERAMRFGREMAELDLRLIPARGAAAARLHSWLRPPRALLEFCGWSLAWLWAGLRSERKSMPARARALWGLEYCKVRLRGVER